MRLRERKKREGATLVEAGFSFLLFLTLVFGMLDLGMGVFRHNILSEAARQGCRQAIVHGGKALSSFNGGPWGPSQIGPVAANSKNVPIVTGIQPYLVGCDLSKTNITAQWIDSSNDVQKRVRVTITTTYTPIMTWIFGNPSFNLTATSTMPIAH